jgi:hypothetical protein
VQLIVDGSDPQTVASATSTAAGIAASGAELSGPRLSARVTAPGPRAQPGVDTWYNPELRTAVFVVPGIVGVILTMTMVMLTAMAIARERERGTLEQLIVSPVRSARARGGQDRALRRHRLRADDPHPHPRGRGLRRPLRGLAAAALRLASLFIAANLALGLAFSTVAKTQQQAMQMSFFFLLPNILLSGFMFPWEGMPAPARYLSQALPLTHFLRITRAVVLRGAGWDDIRSEVPPSGSSWPCWSPSAPCASRRSYRSRGTAPMPRPRSDISERVLHAAARRFLEDGVDGAAMRAIARDAGTSVGMVTYYFPTKDALFAAVVEHAYKGLLDDLGAALAPDAFPSRPRWRGCTSARAR